MRLVRMRKMRLGGLSVAMACLASVSMTAQSPYGWRGPERDGVYFENGLLKEWPSEGPELLCKEDQRYVDYDAYPKLRR